MVFKSWSEVLAHVKAGKPISYQAPFDRNPVPVRCVLTGGKRGLPETCDLVRVFPPPGDADPFNANDAHLPRFSAPDDTIDTPGYYCVCGDDHDCNNGCDSDCPACSTNTLN